MNSAKLLKEIGKQIAVARNRANLTQFGLNRQLHLPDGRSAKDSHIAKFERGELNITLETLAAIAENCGCRIEIKLRKVRGAQPVAIKEEDDLGVPAAIIKMRKEAALKTGS
ncbi:MAG: helix-turn-helix transcriptional regulator [Segetibacter sp.]